VAPLERLKILYQVQAVLSTAASKSATNPAAAVADSKYQGMWQSLRRIGAEEGFRGYFRGNGANCARVFPYTAIQFSVYVPYPWAEPPWAKCSHASNHCVPMCLTAQMSSSDLSGSSPGCFARARRA
jgi:hypothetical protein